jgi:hypothetical protein
MRIPRLGEAAAPGGGQPAALKWYPELLLSRPEGLVLFPIDEVERRRIAPAKSDSDASHFHELLYLGELVLKLTVGGLVACVEDGKERHRYRLEHALVRGDGLGTWVEAAEQVLVGPASQELVPGAREANVGMARKKNTESPEQECVRLLDRVVASVVGQREPLPSKTAISRWLSDFVYLRNKTKGHGAPPITAAATAAPLLERSIQLFIQANPMLALEWVYLRQNASKKYLIRALSKAAPSFDHLKGKTATALPQGVYVWLDEPRRVVVASTDADLNDFYLWNGAFSSKGFELLSYATGNRTTGDATAYMTPATRLPGSFTEGSATLLAKQAAFSNVPSNPDEYVERDDLEKELRTALQLERHEIVTLHGRGGAGKTTLAIQVLRSIETDGRFSLIVWFSARDIDLLPDGPKQVRPQALTVEDLAAEYVRLVRPALCSAKRSEQVQYLATALQQGTEGPTLFVFDNFETVRDPEELYGWLDSNVRPPNKILITTRHRGFRGDFPIEVTGMTRAEADNLITVWTAKLGIAQLMSDSYRTTIYDEAAGHPYIVKMLLGTVAREQRLVDVRRAVAGHENVLTALFERTFLALSAAGRRVFLTLCSWHSLVTLLELKAVLQRPSNERIDVDAAIEELERFALVERLGTGSDAHVFLRVPLAGAIFGSSKLKVDPAKPQVEDDRKLLMWFGAAQHYDVPAGIAPRIERLLRRVAEEASADADVLSKYEPLLEFIGNGAPEMWLEIADLYAEFAAGWELEKRALLAFLEKAASSPCSHRVAAWWRLAKLAERSGDVEMQAHALSELAAEVDAPLFEASKAASEINRCMTSAYGKLDDEAKRTIVARAAAVLEARINEADATDLSRLAWLHLSLRDEHRAREVVQLGLELDAHNPHIQNLANRLFARFA